MPGLFLLFGGTYMGFKQLGLGDRDKYIRHLKMDGHYFPNFYTKVYEDRMDGKSPVIGVVGSPRSGKTLTASFWAWIFDKTFVEKFKENVWVDIDRFIQDVEKKKIKHSSLLIDEAQKDLDPAAWNSLIGRALTKYNGSQAILGNLLFIIIPYARWLPWIQQPAINYIVSVKGHGWAKYLAHKTIAEDFSGKSYKAFIEFKRIPMVPPELLKAKEEWEVPAKQDILSQLAKSVERKAPKKDHSDWYRQRKEYLAAISAQLDKES